MLALLALSALLQQQQAQPPRSPSQRKADSISAAVQKRVERHIQDAAEANQRSKQRQREAMAKLTPAMISSAFKDADARNLLNRARNARMVQDSELTSYDAIAYQRVSAWLGFGRMK